MILDINEVIALTGRQRKDAQIRALRYMGIEHRIRPDGTVAVLKAHVEQSLGLKEASVIKESEPDWSAI
jgi:hypothetical protein